MSWTLTRRETGLIEHTCTHGVGHPNLGSAHRLGSLKSHGNQGYAVWIVHGCDGCCGASDFPGSAVNTFLFSMNLYSQDAQILHNLYTYLKDTFTSAWALMKDTPWEDRDNLDVSGISELAHAFSEGMDEYGDELELKFPFLYYSVVALVTEFEDVEL